MSTQVSIAASEAMAGSRLRKRPARYRAYRLHSPSDPFFAAFPHAGAFQQERFMAALFATIAPEAGALPILIGVEDETGQPLAWFAFTLRRRLGARLLEGLDLDVTDYFSPPLAPGKEVDPEALWQSVLAALPEADAVTLKKVPQRLQGHAHALSGWRKLRAMGASAHSLTLRGERGTLLDLTELSVAKDMRRKSRKLAAAGEVTFSLAATSAETEAALEKLFQFRQERFAALGRPDPLASPAWREFYRTLVTGHEPIARIFTLHVGNETVACVYCLSQGEVLTLIIPAMSSDPAWTPGSPGLVALYRTLEWAQVQGYRVFDLSVGSLDYKHRFNTDQVELFEHACLLNPRGALAFFDAELRRLLRGRMHDPKWRRILAPLRRGRGS